MATVEAGTVKKMGPTWLWGRAQVGFQYSSANIIVSTRMTTGDPSALLTESSSYKSIFQFARPQEPSQTIWRAALTISKTTRHCSEGVLHRRQRNYRPLGMINSPLYITFYKCSFALICVNAYSDRALFVEIANMTRTLLWFFKVNAFIG